MPVTNRQTIKPGDKFARVYLGKIYTCEAKIIGNGLGFETWDGEQFKTLSTAGKHVVKRPGYEINGFVFWNRAEDMPVKRGPKPGSTHRSSGVTPISAVSPVAPVAAVEPVPSVQRRGKKVLAVAVIQQEVAKAQPAPPKMVRNIKPAKGQDDVPAGQKRYFCSACMDTFIAPGSAPAQCPHGHPAKLPATLIEQGAREAVA